MIPRALRLDRAQLATAGATERRMLSRRVAAGLTVP